jgi:hypothetical protein
MIRWLPALIAVMVLLGLGFVFRMGRHDMQALRDFTASYQRFDRTMSEAPGGPGAAQFDAALQDLNARASMRISSLTTNDGAMMRVARQVSEAAAREVTAVNRFKQSAAARNDV